MIWVWYSVCVCVTANTFLQCCVLYVSVLSLYIAVMGNRDTVMGGLQLSTALLLDFPREKTRTRTREPPVRNRKKTWEGGENRSERYCISGEKKKKDMLQKEACWVDVKARKWERIEEDGWMRPNERHKKEMWDKAKLKMCRKGWLK